MARIQGVDLPNDKRVEIGLTAIYGIGRSKSLEILNECGIDPDVRVRDLSDAEINKIRDVIDNSHTVEGDLRREVAMNIKRLVDIGSYRGRRHKQKLPVRGQRSKTNARTQKGPKKVGGKRR